MLRFFPLGILEKQLFLIIITVLWKMTCCVKEVVLFSGPIFDSTVWKELSSLQASMLKVQVQSPSMLVGFFRWENFRTFDGFFFFKLWSAQSLGRRARPSDKKRQLEIKVPIFVWFSSTFWLRLLSYLDKVVNVGIVVLIVLTPCKTFFQ